MVDILFLYPPYHKRIGGGTLFPLGIGYLISGVIKHNCSFDYIDCQSFYKSNKIEFISGLARRIGIEEYRIIAISCITTAAIPFLSDIIEACRLVAKRTPIVLGGQLVSIDYVERLFFKEYDIDAICKGDGDQVIPELVLHLKRGNTIHSFSYVSTNRRIAPKNFISDIDNLPFPYRTEEIVSNTHLSFGRSTYEEKSLTMITSRGCYYKCNYCVSGCNTDFHFQKRSWENIVKEIKFIQEKFNIFSIVFYDDCFFYNKNTVNEEIKAFVTQLDKQKCHPFQWQIELRADIVASISPESWKMIYEMGCSQINIGIESCYNDSLAFLGKGINYNTIEQAFSNLYQSVPEIILTATYIVGGPNSDFKHIIRLAEFSKRMKLMYIRIYPLELHPGTVLYEKFYDKTDEWYRCILSNENSHACMYFERDENKLSNIFQAINETYKIFYNSDYWEKRAIELYGDRYSVVKKNLIKAYNLEADYD